MDPRFRVLRRANFCRVADLSVIQHVRPDPSVREREHHQRTEGGSTHHPRGPPGATTGVDATNNHVASPTSKAPAVTHHHTVASSDQSFGLALLSRVGDLIVGDLPLDRVVGQACFLGSLIERQTP